MGLDGIDWIYRAQDREKKVGGACENDNVIRDSRKLRGVHRNIYCALYSIFVPLQQTQHCTTQIPIRFYRALCK